MPVLNNARHVENALITPLIAKLDALRKIMTIAGWDDGKDHLTEDEVALALYAAARLSSDVLPVQKAACATILDMLVSGWRDAAPPSVLGGLVERDDPLVRRWRMAVLDRDGHACTECDARDNLHAHHIIRWVDGPHLRIVPENGVTLCSSCHAAVHSGDLNLIKGQSNGCWR